ncbi:HGGxSTG domain-containing protein [Solemya velum gill symbiont]|uniref:HGGxSTG domain-containing protein n=1 Tax=Solemya velum gill symbiont TaxID=2340 RepID=UPI00117A7C85|nr:HGGxSTG domain-containing protein [Solemya velum gill symbiont]
MEIYMTHDEKNHTCGARTKRGGQPCKLTSIYSNGRCKFHGGLSTGAKTNKGKRRSAMNGFKKRTP